MELQKLKDNVIPQIRKRIFEVSNRSNSAHVGSCLSCVEMLAYLFHAKKENKYPIEKIILSKGHAAMALYSTVEKLGLLDPKHLDAYMENGTQLWGHPSKSDHFDFIDWSTGALGHGLPATVGFAYSAKILKKNTQSIFTCVVSDGECDEGSNWEAALFASHHKLSNLVAIIDYNKIQSFGFCEDIMNLEPFKDKWEAFGWDVQQIDGHDLNKYEEVFANKNFTDGKPLCIIADTVKAKGHPTLENTIESHYKPVSDEQLKEFMK